MQIQPEWQPWRKLEVAFLKVVPKRTWLGLPSRGHQEVAPVPEVDLVAAAVAGAMTVHQGSRDRPLMQVIHRRPQGLPLQRPRRQDLRFGRLLLNPLLLNRPNIGLIFHNMECQCRRRPSSLPSLGNPPWCLFSIRLLPVRLRCLAWLELQWVQWIAIY